MNAIAGALLVAATGLLLVGCGPPAVGSVGAVLGRDRETGALHVREAPEGLAAAEAGLLPGDQIKLIDGVLVDELDQTKIRAMLRGEVGTTVRLTILRGEEVLHVELVRREMGAAAPPPAAEERIEP
jgi:carboxyl-terminal processing protease